MHNMSVITLPKLEYENLKKKARAYEELAGLVFKKARTGSINETVKDFRKIGMYSDGFLRDLKSGLEKSSRAKK